VRLLENSAAKQVVVFTKDKIAIVFWAAGEIVLPDGRRIATDEPCLILVSAQTTLIVDPTQKLKQLHFKIDDREHEVMLPTGAAAGTASVL
jgi:hypothetical protein